MKKASFIINHIQSIPLNEKVSKIRSYKKLLSLLPVTLQKGVRFMYNKNNTLFFVLEHQGYKMEFDNIQRPTKYRENFIKSLLKDLIKHDPSVQAIDANHIKAFVTNKAPRQKDTYISLPIYKERSDGEFKNRAKSQKLHKLFEEIRESICSHKA